MSRRTAGDLVAGPVPAGWGRGQRLKNDVLYGLARAAMGLVGRLPLVLSRPLGALVGLAGWALARAERRRAVEGLATAFPGASARWRSAVARRCFARLGRSAAEVCRLARLGRRAGPWVLEQVAMEDRAVLDRALAEGRGVVWATAHLGNWELLAAGLAARGYLLRPFAKGSYDPRLTELVDSWRRAVGVESIWRGRPGVAEAVGSTLRSGGIVGVLMDQDTRVRGAFVPFFGRPAWTPTGAAELARTTGAAVVAGFIRRGPGGRHEIRLARVRTTRTGDAAADDAANTAALTAAIEAEVRARPEDWVWMHPRWKTRPPGEEPRP